MEFQLNEQQEFVVQEAIKFYKESPEQIFQFTGPPGTGKSVVLFEILKRLNLPMYEVAPMAFTGAAAIVMRLKGLSNARTIHSWLYEPVEVPLTDEYGNVVMDNYLNRPVTTIRFVRRKEIQGIKLIIFDEGWTVPKYMLNDILSIGAKIIVAGDPDQLPPVGDEPCFFTRGRVYRLSQVMRQAQGSPIVYLADRAINNLPIHTGNYGNVLVITENELTNEMLKYAQVVLCGKNSTRDMYNRIIREDILGFNGDLPKYGEKLICRHNNWSKEINGISLTNGLSGFVCNNPDVSGFNGREFTIDFMPQIANDLIFKDIKADYKYLNSDKKQRDTIKNNRYFKENLFEFGYTQTVHLAQGSQWRNGLYIEEYIHPDINKHLNYTAITRFSDMCIYVKPKRKWGVHFEHIYGKQK